MRTPGLENKSVGKHLIRRLMGRAARGQRGAPRVLQSGATRVETLLFTTLLRNALQTGSGTFGRGDFEAPYVDHAQVSANQDNYDLGTGIVHTINPTADINITGFVAPAPDGSIRGTLRLLIHGDTGKVTFKHNQTSDSVNRLVTPRGQDLIWLPSSGLSTASSMVGMYYSGSRWLMIPLSMIEADRLARLGLGGEPDATAPLRIVGGELLQETAANGAVWKRGYSTELMTIAAAASSDSSADLLPANAIIEAVVVRVTVAIPTATNFDVGTSSSANRFDDNVGVAANTTSVGIDHWKGNVTTETAGPTQRNAAKVRITPNATPANADGRVRVTVFYRTFVAPTS